MRLNDESELEPSVSTFGLCHYFVIRHSTFDIRRCCDAGRGEHRNIYPPGFGDFVGAAGGFCGCAFKSWFRGAPAGGIVPGVGPMDGSPGGRSAGAGADVLALSSARSFNHA